jgi:hypothetical protein
VRSDPRRSSEVIKQLKWRQIMPSLGVQVDSYK